MSNWEAILKWSLKYHDGTRNEPQMDQERREWLEKALESIASAPSETQLLQAALTVLKAHSPAGGDEKAEEEEEEEEEEGGEEEEQLLKAFEDMLYLIEDLDHANDLIPMKGVDIISSYLQHRKPTRDDFVPSVLSLLERLSIFQRSLVQSACELIATATQNNPKTQEAFLTTLHQLISILNDRSFPPGVGVKAIYAVSCLTRSYEPGVKMLLSVDGLATLRLCLAAEEHKIVIKTLFLLMSYFSPGQGEVKDEMVSQLPSLVPEVVSLVRTASNEEVKVHALSLLVTMVMHHPVAVVESRREEVGLREVLVQLRESWNNEDHQEELASVKILMETCFP